jgi:hypothetical protein
VSVRHLALVFACFVLAGCYVSKAPLITPATADYPIADGARFTASAPAGSGWVRRPARTVRRVGAWYVYREDGRPKPSLPFLLKRVAPNVYVAQLSDHADPKRAREYSYQLIRFDGTTAIQYPSLCPAHPEWVKRGLVDRVEETQTRRCIFSSLAKLSTALQEAARSAAPEARYVLAKPR